MESVVDSQGICLCQRLGRTYYPIDKEDIFGTAHKEEWFLIMIICEYPASGYMRSILYYQALAIESTIKINASK